jgi:ketosteroid isomerase-like protein
MNLRDQPIVHAMARESLGAAGQLVWDFLTLFAEQRYAEANAHLAPGCQMLFPGGAVFTDCTELPVRAASIYRWVKKVFERFDEHQTPDGTVVYNYGGLRGEWLDGEPFEGVRYIDRFLVRNGRIVDQKVWNDLCLAAAARARGGR